MEELREKLNILVKNKGLLDKETIYVSQKLDKLIVNYYESKKMLECNHL